MKTITKLTGYAATDAAESNPELRLNKYADPTEGPREGLSLDEALEVAEEDPSLIWAEAEVVVLAGPQGPYYRFGGIYSHCLSFEDYWDREIEAEISGVTVIDSDGKTPLYPCGDGATADEGVADDARWTREEAEAFVASFPECAIEGVN